MEIRRIPIEAINPAEYNPRKDLQPGDREYDALAASIKEFGYVDPLIWNERTGKLVGGHQRFKILQDLGYQQAEVSVVDLDPQAEKALNLALNRIQGGWDPERLTELLQELMVGGADLGPTGFSEKDIDRLLSEFEPLDLDDESEWEAGAAGEEATCPKCGFQFTP